MLRIKGDLFHFTMLHHMGSVECILQLVIVNSFLLELNILMIIVNFMWLSVYLFIKFVISSKLVLSLAGVSLPLYCTESFIYQRSCFLAHLAVWCSLHHSLIVYCFYLTKHLGSNCIDFVP